MKIPESKASHQERGLRAATFAEPAGGPRGHCCWVSPRTLALALLGAWLFVPGDALLFVSFV